MPSRQTEETALAAGEAQQIGPVRKSVRVRSSPEHAFRVFTHEMDSWWPINYHIES